MDRRKFGAMLAAAGIAPTTSLFAAGPAPEVIHLERNGWMPNNPLLPVLLYHAAFSAADDTADRMEAVFQKNGWPGQWRNGVYDFHHYHSTAHEVLGFAGGSARLMLGGEGGHEILVQSGDVVVLPAGTGHCKLSASPNFLVVGAYPSGATWDICRRAPEVSMVEAMKHVYFPASDPVSGRTGVLVSKWKRVGNGN